MLLLRLGDSAIESVLYYVHKSLSYNIMKPTLYSKRLAGVVTNHYVTIFWEDDHTIKVYFPHKLNRAISPLAQKPYVQGSNLYPPDCGKKKHVIRVKNRKKLRQC